MISRDLVSAIAAVLVAVAVDADGVIDGPLVAVVVRLRTGVDAQPLHVLDAVN